MIPFFKSFFQDVYLFGTADWMTIENIRMDCPSLDSLSFEEKVTEGLGWIENDIPIFCIADHFGQDIANEVVKRSKRKFFCMMTR